MSDVPSPSGPQDACERDRYTPEHRAEDRAEAEEAIWQSREALKLLDENPEVRHAFARHGFGPEKIEEGRRLLQNLIDAMEHEQAAWRRVHEAEAAQRQLEEDLLRTFAVHAHMARDAFKDDPEALWALGLDQPLPPMDPTGLEDAEDGAGEGSG